MFFRRVGDNKDSSFVEEYLRHLSHSKHVIVPFGVFCVAKMPNPLEIVFAFFKDGDNMIRL